MAAVRLPVRLPTFDSRLIEDLALLVKLTAAQLRPIAEVAVRLIVSKVRTGYVAERLACIFHSLNFSMERLLTNASRRETRTLLSLQRPCKADQTKSGQ